MAHILIKQDVLVILFHCVRSSTCLRFWSQIFGAKVIRDPVERFVVAAKHLLGLLARVRTLERIKDTSETTFSRTFNGRNEFVYRCVQLEEWSRTTAP